MSLERLTPSPILGLLYELVPVTTVAADVRQLAALVFVEHHAQVVHHHVVLLGVVLQVERHLLPALIVDDGELSPVVVPEQ